MLETTKEKHSIKGRYYTCWCTSKKKNDVFQSVFTHKK